MIHSHRSIVKLYKYHPKGFLPYIFKYRSYIWSRSGPSSIGLGYLIFLWKKCLILEKVNACIYFLQLEISLTCFSFNLNGHMYMSSLLCEEMGAGYPRNQKLVLQLGSWHEYQMLLNLDPNWTFGNRFIVSIELEWFS